MRASASSTARSSLASRRPADFPRRRESTTVVCSTSTRVSDPFSLIGGRKLAGRALVDVGETRTVLRPRSSSAWTTTAYRAPRCSRPPARRRAGRRKTSPRTKSVAQRRRELRELFADDAHFFPIADVGSETAGLVAKG